jgi:EAL domain-containing protein (putative c-di-GMP-specific phosphodiesterase class I)
MSPKSRLYTLVHAWKNKPFHELSDVQGTHALNAVHETQDAGSNANWSKRQTVSYEPIFNAAGNAMPAALFRPLLSASDSQVLRLTMEGLDAASYWHCCNRPIQIVLPLSPSIVANAQRIDALCDLILNSRLPVGLVHVGITAIPSEAIRANCKEGLLRLRRIGVLLHLMNANPQSIQPQWLEEMKFDGIHFSIQELRSDDIAVANQQAKLLDALAMARTLGAALYATGITLIKDLENARLLPVDFCYGGLMMSPVSRHQILHISDSRIAKAIFAVKPHGSPNQNGDKQ